MSYRPDDHDLERSHELERQLDRDFERERYRRSGSNRRSQVSSASLEAESATTELKKAA
jgi:hypothetical protein